ncbi:MAG: pyrimidine-nucleoside phosphorylase [Ruminiclostridium sp.]|nr:pyrimidine-nucleoside phosphorylase [Ruminiclostridium sp.]
MRMYDVIERKRDGKDLSYEELEYFITGYCKGEIPDYQASALLMAIYLRGMNQRETADLTVIMANSGDRIDLSDIEGIKVDKHSTGGVGDKTTLVLAPIVAACGVPVAKISGRGLGHTGGTIDKLESIKGFRTSLTKDEFIDNVRSIGLSVAGQTGNMAPADKKLYALRDVTATVSNISLIASSIMSKKIASGTDRIVLDVKTGSGAFMKTFEDAAALAGEMVSIGEKTGRKTVALITNMDMPLGNAVGNALEVKEAVSALIGKGPADLEKVSFELAARMIELAGLGSIEYCRELVRKKIQDGSAIEKFSQMVRRQGGLHNIGDESWLADDAAFVTEVLSPADGYISSLRTDALGKVSVILGAGRETKESNIDHAAGIMLYKKPGMKVSKKELIARLYSSSNDRIHEAEAAFLDSISFDTAMHPQKPLILGYIDIHKTEIY